MSEEYYEPQIKSTIGISQTFNLTATDLKHRGESFLDENTLRLAGIRRVSDDEGHQILNISTRKKGVEYTGLAIPYFNTLKMPEIWEFEIRRDNPEWEEDGNGQLKKKRKYIKPVKSRNLLYIAPMVKPEWLKDKKKPKVFTEGAFKALALARVASNNFTTEDWAFIPLAISGVDNFKTKLNRRNENGETVKASCGLLEFDLLEFEKVPCIIAFDSDANQNQNVMAARDRFMRFLRGRKAKVFFTEFPREHEGIQTKGIDDYLGAIERTHGTEAAIQAGFELINQAQKPKKTVSPIAENFTLIQDGEGTPGVYYTDENGERFRVCSPLLVAAETQTQDGENYGRLLEWHDSQNRSHNWAMPIEFIHSEGAELAKHLASKGLEIMPSRKHREKLAFYIATSKPERTIISTYKIGLQNNCFVLPDETIGEAENKIVYQSEFEGHHNFNVLGTLSDWEENISKYCSGNPLLMVAVSAAFASPLLPIVRERGGGLHFRGLSSLGKTTTLYVAGSVWGGDSEHGFLQTWKGTAGGLEGIAASHNHALLCLDEISECDAREVGNVAYMLANGRGKIRMTKTIQVRKPLSWNLFLLSTGEKSLADIISESGGSMKGGQDVRLCDIEADSGKFGIFENLHGFSNGAELSSHLQSASCKYYGTASREFLRFLIKDNFGNIRNCWQSFKNKFAQDCLEEINEKAFVPEVGRVADRFALIALGGELAANAKVTNWQMFEAYNAAKTVFLKWLDGRGGNSQIDAEKAFQQVIAFFEANPSRFQNVELSDETPRDRVGYFYKDKSSGETTFYIFPQAFRRELAKGFDYRFVAQTLFERGYLKSAKAEPAHIPNIRTKRVYEMSDILVEKEMNKNANV